MKVKTLLKTLRNTEYVLQSESGWTKEEGYVGNEYYDDSAFEDSKVLTITTVCDCSTLFITIK